MDSLHTLLAGPHLSVITRCADLELVRIQNIIENKVLVDGRVELEECFGRLLLASAGKPTPKTLDLIGHSMPGTSLLKLGDWVIDAASPMVSAYFRELADNDVFTRLGIHGLRLLGCLTASTDEAIATISALADLIGVEVYGSTSLLYARHYDEKGFSEQREYLLTSSRDLHREQERRDWRPVADGTPYARTLDIDGLPTSPFSHSPSGWPQRLASHRAARSILDLVRRTEGAAMPGLLAVPHCEIWMPSAITDKYHRIQIILDGEFIRAYPDGDDKSAVVFPVDSPLALRRIVDTLPTI